MVCCLYSGGAHRRPPMHRTGTQGCAPVLYTHCCRRSPRQIRGRGASDAAAKCSSIGHAIKVSYLCHEHRCLLGDAAMSNPPVLPALPRKRAGLTFQLPPVPQFCWAGNAQAGHPACAPMPLMKHAAVIGSADVGGVCSIAGSPTHCFWEKRRERRK